MVKGPITGLNNKLSDILLTVKERAKVSENILEVIQHRARIAKDSLPALKMN
jgi:hypothetical protein